MCCSIFVWRNDSLKNVGNGIARTQFHFQRNWKPIVRTQFHFQRGWKPIVWTQFHFQRGWKPIVWTQFHFQRDWKPISDGNSISNAVGSLLRGRNGISNVFGRRHAIAKQLRHEVNRLLLRAVTMFFVFKNYPNKSSVSCSRSASCFRRWRLPCGVMISSLSKRVRMTVVTT